MRIHHTAVRILSVAAATLFGAAIATAQDSDLDARIDEAQQRYEEAWTSGDADALAEMHTEDAVMWPASGGMHEGRDAIRGYFEQGPQPESIDIKSERAERIGDLILDVGTFSATMPAEAGGQMEGEYVVIAREIEGELRLERIFAGPRREPSPAR